MDEVGIPEQMLWQMYDKMVVARLVRQGYSALTAREMVDKKQPVAHQALVAETRLAASDLVWPLFVHDHTAAAPVAAMPRRACAGRPAMLCVPGAESPRTARVKAS